MPRKPGPSAGPPPIHMMMRLLLFRRISWAFAWMVRRNCSAGKAISDAPATCLRKCRRFMPASLAMDTPAFGVWRLGDVNPRRTLVWLFEDRLSRGAAPRFAPSEQAGLHTYTGFDGRRRQKFRKSRSRLPGETLRQVLPGRRDLLRLYSAHRG